MHFVLYPVKSNNQFLALKCCFVLEFFTDSTKDIKIKLTDSESTGRKYASTNSTFSKNNAANAASINSANLSVNTSREADPTSDTDHSSRSNYDKTPSKYGTRRRYQNKQSMFIPVVPLLDRAVYLS